MIEERFESYVYQIMQYVKYQENKPYIESILEEMRYTLFREDRNYIKQLEQENKQLKEKIDILLEDNNQLEEIRIKVIEYIKDLYDVRFTDKDKRKLLEILGDKENE